MVALPKLFSWLTLLCCLSTGTLAEDKPFFPTAPDFPPGLEWLNVSRPLQLADLRGKVVILDFWTYGCINCIHVMDDLKRLKNKYGHSLVVVGVHSPKFENEQNLDNLRSVLARYQRDEPVVNDPDYLMMKRYRAPAWPTLVVIDPFGNYVGKVVGEGHYERLDLAIGELLKIHVDDIDDAPLAVASIKTSKEQGWFGAPEKIAASDDRIAVSDSLLHRILITRPDGRLTHTLGGTEPGFRDGSLEQARFSAPRGLAFADDGSLYVADTGNHVIRRVDLSSNQVNTIAGRGNKGESLSVPAGAKPLDIGLRSPWGLALAGSNLYIAMAGDHRIWHMDLEKNQLKPFAGSGREGIDDGAAQRATFSQPSALALVGDTLYVADAEASAIRQVNLLTGNVSTLAGTGLHDFGDRSGKLASALLQHAQGIAPWKKDELLVADTYNHRIKLLNTRKETIESLLGSGTPGLEGDGNPVLFNEPGGLAVQNDRVLIADTNNRRILVYYPDNGKVETLRLHNPPD